MCKKSDIQWVLQTRYTLRQTGDEQALVSVSHQGALCQSILHRHCCSAELAANLHMNQLFLLATTTTNISTTTLHRQTDTGSC